MEESEDGQTVMIPVYGQLSDSTGLVNRLDVQTGGHNFEVETIANFDIHDFDYYCFDPTFVSTPFSCLPLHRTKPKIITNAIHITQTN